MANGGLIQDNLEAACLSHDQCHSWTGGSIWNKQSKYDCDRRQRLNGLLICNYLKNVYKVTCFRDVELKFVAHTQKPLSVVSAGFYASSQLSGCGKLSFFGK